MIVMDQSIKGHHRHRLVHPLLQIRYCLMAHFLFLTPTFQFNFFIPQWIPLIRVPHSLTPKFVA